MFEIAVGGNTKREEACRSQPNASGPDDGDGDIYIMVKCLSVCLSVTKNDHFL